jgi:hypothetical protein
MAMTVTALRQLPARVVSEATGANIRTVERWRAGSRPRRHAYRLRLDDLAAVLEVLGEAMAPRARQAWLTARSAHLGWQRPVDVLAAGEFDLVRGAALAYAGGDVT